MAGGGCNVTLHWPSAGLVSFIESLVPPLSCLDRFSKHERDHHFSMCRSLSSCHQSCALPSAHRGCHVDSNILPPFRWRVQPNNSTAVARKCSRCTARDIVSSPQYCVPRETYSPRRPSGKVLMNKGILHAQTAPQEKLQRLVASDAVKHSLETRPSLQEVQLCRVTNSLDVFSCCPSVELVVNVYCM